MSETFSSLDDAAVALSQATSAPEPGQAPAAPTPPAGTSDAAPVTPEGSPSPEGTTGTPDSFTRTDLGSLLEGVTDPAVRQRIEDVYKGFQGDYTRSKQSLAEQAKLYEGLDPQRARDSIQFVEALESNPDFAVRVHQELTSALQQQGYSLAEASAAATSALDDTSSLGGGEDEPVSALAKEVQDLRAWREQQEAQQSQQQLAAHIQRQEMAIRQSDPNLTDADVGRVYELAWAHGGDLNKAYESFKGLRDAFITSYIDAKSEVPPATPPVTGHAETPPEAPVSMSDADKLAREYLERELANP